jgi:hypothetical protein
MSLTGSLFRVALRGGVAPVRAGGAVLGATLALEHRVRVELLSVGGKVSLDALDALLASDAIDRVLERVEAAGVAQHVAQRMLEDGIAEQIVTRILQGDELEQMISNAVDSERTRDRLARALESEGIERLADRLLRSPGSERLLAQVLQSPLMRETVTQLLESEELWTLVDEIARSPSVTDAITQQSAGFLDQVAGTVRDRSRDADAWVERAARRIGRRRAHRELLEAGEAKSGAEPGYGEQPGGQTRPGAGP